MSMCSLLLCCWTKVFAMTSVFSWQNSISLCPASFCTPRSDLPVTPGVSWLPTCVFQLHRTVQLQLLPHYWSGYRLGLPWYWIACLTKLRKSYFAPSTPWLCRNQIQDKVPKELHHWFWNLCLKHSSNMENRPLLSLQQFPSSSQMESRISNSMLPGDYVIFT